MVADTFEQNRCGFVAGLLWNKLAGKGLREDGWQRRWGRFFCFVPARSSPTKLLVLADAALPNALNLVTVED